MSNYAQGMEKLFRGILKYGNTFKGQMVKQFKQVRDNPRPTAVFVTCVDSRMLPTRFTQTNVGDMFIVRNVGNMVPNVACVSPSATATEPALLELGCVINGIRHVIVCGHSDCKAMNLLYTCHKIEAWEKKVLDESPLRSWMTVHGMKSLRAFEEIEKSKFRKPLILHAESMNEQLEAYIDIDSKFSDTDKLSQVHCLLQMENVASYPFMKPLINDGKTHIHALWFDIYTGEIYYFSRTMKHFVLITDANYEYLLAEIEASSGGKFDKSAAKKILEFGQQHVESHQECKH